MLGFSVYCNVPVELNVREAEKGLFSGDTTQFTVDFRATSVKGMEYWYEILAHPNEDPDGIAKVRMFQEQHPDRKLVVITAGRYKALEKAFANRIRQAADKNSRKRFAGWERKGYNLDTHPDVFG